MKTKKFKQIAAIYINEVKDKNQAQLESLTAYTKKELDGLSAYYGETVLEYLSTLNRDFYQEVLGKVEASCCTFLSSLKDIDEYRDIPHLYNLELAALEKAHNEKVQFYQDLAVATIGAPIDFSNYLI